MKITTMIRLGGFFGFFGIFLLLHLLSVILMYRKLSLEAETQMMTVDGMNAILRRQGVTSTPINVPKIKESHLVYVYNSWKKERYVCGKPIPPNATIEINMGDCITEDVILFGRVFPTLPSLSGQEERSPIIVRFQDRKQKNHLKNVSSCDIPCKVWPTGTPSTRDPATIDGTPFQFAAYSMEGSGIYHSLEIKPTNYLNYKYYATTSFKSEVPLSYYDGNMYDIQHPPVDFAQAIKGASFIARNCDSFSGRENLFKELIQSASSTSFQIDSLSSCMRNALPPKGVDMKNKTDVMKEYLFHFSFENQRTPDYITEKLWGALASGTLPVYLGAPNIKEHVPPHSIIIVDDFSSAEELVSYLIKVANNESLYNSYHAWRKKPLPTFFQEKYNFTQVHSYCRVCRFSYAMKYGWGWDYSSQQVRPLKLPRGTCLDEHGMMSSPIKESWVLHHSSPGVVDEHTVNNEKDCNVENKSTIQIPGTGWKRTISDHDFVTDIEITKLAGVTQETEAILRLQMPINTTRIILPDSKDQYQQRVYFMQDDISRIIVVFNETTTFPEELEFTGILDIPINKPIRIRLIVEDIDTFHDNGKRKSFRPDGFLQETYFGSLMIDEFFHPLELSTKEINAVPV